MEKSEMREIVKDVIEEMKKEQMQKDYIELKSKVSNNIKKMKIVVYLFLVTSILWEITVLASNNFSDIIYQFFPIMFLLFSLIQYGQYKLIDYRYEKMINKSLDLLTLEDIKHMKQLSKLM